MINPNNSSVDYGNMLKTPAGYVVDFAIATTYSLDMQALMGACLSLGLSVDTDSTLANDPMYLFAALSEMRGKLLVFCEKGRILGRTAYPALYCQLESSIVEVDLPAVNASPDQAGPHFENPSFHPKTWIIRFVPASGEGAARYRICILSRNLTFDSSWDLACSADGNYRTDHKQASDGGWSIRAYLESLKNLCSDKSFASKLDKMVSEIAYVPWNLKEKDFELALPFSFTHINSARTFREEFDKALNASSRALVITPFISSASGQENPLVRMADHFEGGSKPLLVTRRYSLASNPNALERLKAFDLFAIRDDLVAAEFEQDDGTEDPENAESKPDEDTQLDCRDIHAKLYLFERAGEDGQADLFIGSANASPRGFLANCEAMAHLSLPRPHAFDRFIGELGLTPDEIERGSLFEPLTPDKLARLVPPSEDELRATKLQREFDLLLRKMSPTMRICKHEDDDSFDVTVVCPSDSPLVQHCTIALATEKAGTPMEQEVIFGNVVLQKLTEFIRISCKHDGLTSARLMKCHLKSGAEYLEQQRKSLFKAVTKNRFAEYLDFRLSGNPELVASLAGERASFGTSTYKGATSRYDGLYENLLRAYVTKPVQTDALVAECLQMLAPEEGEESGDEQSEVRELLRVVQEGARYAR